MERVDRQFYLSGLIIRVSSLLLVSGLGYCNEPLRITVTDSFGPSRIHFQAIAQDIAAIVADKFVAQPPIDAQFNVYGETAFPKPWHFLIKV